jgi:hypothetical protein
MFRPQTVRLEVLADILQDRTIAPSAGKKHQNEVFMHAFLGL